MAFTFPPLRRIGRKLDRLIHEARGAWCARFGPPLEIVSAAPAIRERISIRPPARTVWENPLEEAYYGTGEDRAVVEHAEALLYRLQDISITGSEALVFAGPHTLLRLDRSMNTFAPRKVRRPISWLARRVDGPMLPLGGAAPATAATSCASICRACCSLESVSARASRSKYWSRRITRRGRESIWPASAKTLKTWSKQAGER